jgi:protein arginine N-methyltransferase 1
MSRAASLARLDQLVAIHGQLLADRKRNTAFAAALARRVRPGSAVLDIGSGSGIWAVLAARLGAARAVAVEREPLLVPLIRALAEENGVAGRVEAVCGDARRVALPRIFDVVVCETIGNLGFDEGVLPILADARARFLRPGGALVPERVALLAAPVRGRAPQRAPIRCRAFRELALHFPGGGSGARLLPLARARPLVALDLRRARAAPTRLAAAWRVADGGRVGALALWVRLGLAPGVCLETLAGTHWSPLLLGLEPLRAGPGRLKLVAELDRVALRWRVEWRQAGRSALRDYSPLFAWGWLAPRLSPSRASQRRR